MMFKNILVALDGSELAEQAIPYVSQLARAFRSRVIVVGVASPTEPRSGGNRLYQIYLDRMVADFADRKVLAVSRLVNGDPYTEIIALAEKEKTDLLSITTVGHGGLGPWKMGSVAEKIITTAEIPVLLVPAKEGGRPVEDAPVLRKVLFPIDVFQLDEKALPWVATLIKRSKASLILLNIAPKPYAPMAIIKKWYDETAKYLESEALKYLRKTARILARLGVDAELEIRVGEAADVIVQYASQNNIDLIAMSTHSRPGVFQWSLGSVAHRVIHGAPVPVLMVRPGRRGSPVPEG
jgi:nucleotide-binding universal stress UspA family protein